MPARLSKGSSETALKTKVLALLRKEFPGVWLKIHSNGFTGAGTSDILGCYFGYFVAIELKAPGKYTPPDAGMTDLQRIFLRRVRACGGWTCCADSVEEVRLFMKKIPTC